MKSIAASDSLNNKVFAVAEGHLASHSAVRVQDVYKLIYQSCMGPEHAISDPAFVSQRLTEEWQRVAGDKGLPHEPLFEDITIAVPMYRLTIRTAIAKGISAAEVETEFVGLAASVKPNPKLLHKAWTAVIQLIQDGRFASIPYDQAVACDRWLREHGFPPVSHSNDYRAANRPAYRLVGETMVRRYAIIKEP